MKCPYCGRRAIKVRADKIYKVVPKGLEDKLFFACIPCDAYVGTHAGTGQPMGTLAKHPLRVLRSRVHAMIDPLWKPDAYLRRLVYYQLSRDMGLHPSKCHVAMFDEDQCREAIRIARRYTREQFIEKQEKRK